MHPLPHPPKAMSYFNRPTNEPVVLVSPAVPMPTKQKWLATSQRLPNGEPIVRQRTPILCWITSFFFEKKKSRFGKRSLKYRLWEKNVFANRSFGKKLYQREPNYDFWWIFCRCLADWPRKENRLTNSWRLTKNWRLVIINGFLAIFGRFGICFGKTGFRKNRFWNSVNHKWFRQRLMVRSTVNGSVNR